MRKMLSIVSAILAAVTLLSSTAYAQVPSPTDATPISASDAEPTAETELAVTVSPSDISVVSATDAQAADSQGLYGLYIKTIGAEASISGSSVTVTGEVTCKDTATSCDVIVFLQRREIGATTWVNYTFSTGSGTTSCSASRTMPTTEGYEYRAKVEGSANDGAEEKTAYSGIVQCPAS